MSGFGPSPNFHFFLNTALSILALTALQVQIGTPQVFDVILAQLRKFWLSRDVLPHSYPILAAIIYW